MKKRIGNQTQTLLSINDNGIHQVNNQPLIFTIVLNWNGGNDTYRCVSSLQKTNNPNFDHKIVVVDNNSSDNSINLIKGCTWLVPVEIIHNDNNLGYAGGNNVGIRHALDNNADYIFILNNDTIVDRNLFSELLEAANMHPKSGVLGAINLFMENPNIVSFNGAQWDNSALCFHYPDEGENISSIPGTPHPTDYICGAAMFFKAEVARKIGLMDERFFLTWEESDWCFRARNSGYECTMVPKAKIWHSVAASFSGESSPLRVYFTIRNRLLWAEKNLTTSARVRMFVKTVFKLAPVFYMQKDNHRPFYKRFIWAIRQYYLDCKKLWGRPQHQAKRIAIKDYLFRSFGNCPEKVRQLNRQSPN